MSASNPFNFNNWLNHDGDGGKSTKDNFQIAQNNRIHSPDDSNINSVTLVGATIVDVRTPQNAALVGKNGCVNDFSIGVYGQSDGPKPFRGIGVTGACDEGCGVAGIATKTTAADLPPADLPPGSTGVYGRGDFYGVYGVSGTIPLGSPPDLSLLVDSTHPTQQPVAVLGAMGDNDQAPAILGLNGILAEDLTKPNFKQAARDLANQAVGVEGVSRDGNGVIGISFDLNRPSTDLPIDPRVAHQFNDALHDPLDLKLEPVIQSVGVAGLSMTGPGVRGISEFDRGGLFQSGTALDMKSFTVAPVAQIRLVPLRKDVPALTGQVPLPRNGQVGDLLALVVPDANDRFVSCDLWFCVATRDRTSGVAQWGKVQFSTLVEGSV
jgi:hypothetical protein